MEGLLLDDTHISTAMLSPAHILPPDTSRPSAWKRSVLQCDEDKIRISPARIAKSYFPDKSTPKPNQRQFLKSIDNHRLHRFGYIALSPKILAQPITYFRFTVAHRQIAFILKKQADAAYRLISSKQMAKLCGLRRMCSIISRLSATLVMRRPAAHRPDFRVSG